MQIPLIKPFINDEIKQKVLEVLDSGYLTEGPVTRSLEDKIRNYIGCKYAIAVTSCTAGLELALRAMKIGPGDEVIVPDYTYPATAAVISIVGATPVLVDINKDNMLIDTPCIEKAITKKTKAIIPVSLFGNPLNYSDLLQLKEKYNLYLVEDAACSLGSEYNGRKTGNWADISVFSFHPRKFITTGEGGIITTNNTSWANWMNSYKHFGMNLQDANREGIQFEIIGTNFKLSNVLAAIGLVQMDYIETLLKRRRELAENYLNLLSYTSTVSFPKVTTNSIHSYQSFCIFIPELMNTMKRMREGGIEVQIGSYSLHKHAAFNKNNKVRHASDFNGSNYAFNNCMVLPLYHDLSIEDQEVVVKNLLDIISK